MYSLKKVIGAPDWEEAYKDMNYSLLTKQLYGVYMCT